MAAAAGEQEGPSFPDVYPAICYDPRVRSEVAAVAAAAAEGEGTLGVAIRRVSQHIRHVANDTPIQYTTLCSLLAILRFLVHAAHKAAQARGGGAEALRELCKVPVGSPRGEGSPQRSRNVLLLAADELVGLLLYLPAGREDPVKLGARCEVLTALIVCCAEVLYSAPSTGGATVPSKDAEHGVLAHLVWHKESGRLCEELVCLALAADRSHQAQGQTPVGSGTTLGSVLYSAGSMMLPSALMRQVSASGSRQVQQLSAHLGRRAALLLCALLYQGRNAAAAGAPSRLHVALRGFSPALAAGAASAALTSKGEVRHGLCGGFLVPGAMGTPEMQLLFHALLCSSEAFLEAVLMETDVAAYVVPLLHAIHEKGAHGAPVALATLQLLSMHNRFAESAHRERIPHAAWEKERDLRDATVGSCIVVEMVRAAQRNTADHGSFFRTQQALAVVCNLSGTARGLHPHAAQRLVFVGLMLERMVTRRRKLGIDDRGPMQALCDVLGAVCSCLGEGNVSTNISLVYELLHQRSRLDRLAPLSHDVVRVLQPVRKVLSRFEGKLEAAQLGPHPGFQSVMHVLHDAAPEVMCEELHGDRFAFAECHNPEGFFVPYTWDLITHYYADTECSPEWDIDSLPIFTPIPLQQVENDPSPPSAATPSSRAASPARSLQGASPSRPLQGASPRRGVAAATPSAPPTFNLVADSPSARGRSPRTEHPHSFQSVDHTLNLVTPGSPPGHAGGYRGVELSSPGLKL
eukprot:Hpha_TRINITY_DN16904_c1_g3::TRINITY_DN16904_c1_g3_i1::g.54546::m.54546